ncbi:MAG: diadenylate cyclase, partial [Hominenteromicrobium mulieris]
PLHDGAMIIRDGMIHAAGCILPLTKNTSVSAELGTRHRAALGVSEESDAVVVVVSEETGQISVAVNGVLARRFTRDTLRDVLEGYLIPQEEASTVRRKFDVLKSKRTVKK